MTGHGADTTEHGPGHRPGLPVARGLPGAHPWPPFPRPWRGRAELAADPAARQAYRDAVARRELTPAGPAGGCVDLITDLPLAADLVAALAGQAEDVLSRAGRC